MAKINCVWAAVLLFTVCKAQFFYNDDEQPAYQQPRDNEYEYDRSPPAPRTDPEPANHQPAPPAPPVRVPEYEHRPEPSRARRSGSGHRPRQPPPQRPRVYSPSVFENLAVGKAPPGVSIPEDSFLNILTNGGRSTHARQSPVYEPPPPQQTSFVHPPSAQPRSPPRYAQSPAYEPSPPQQTSFVQPPPAQPRSPPAYAQSPPPVRARAPVTDNRRYPTGLAPPPPPPRVQSRASPPAVHNLPHAEGAQPEPIENPVQYRAPAVPVQPSPQHSNRRRSGVRLRQITPSRSSWNSADEERQRQRRVFSPSVFENLGPGIAPSGVHVPENSFLNILRNDRHISRTRRDQDYELGPPDEPVPQYAPVQYSAEPRSSARELPTDYELPQKVQSVQPAPRRVAPKPQPPSPQQEFVDNTAHHQTTEQQPRVTEQRKPVQSRRRVSVRRHRQYSSSVPDSDPNEEEIYRQPKQFAPSVFEKFELGEAPPGIHVPEDSILNLLRGDRPATRARSSQSPPRKRPHAPQYVPPPEAEPVVSEDAYEEQNRRSPPQRHQSTPIQEYHPANAQPPREIRRPIAQEAPQPAVAPRVAQPPKRQRHRSQPVHAPQPQPVYEVPNAVYNAPSHLQEEEEDILRYRSQNNNQRTRQQEQAPQRKRGNTAPRYVPPPQQQEPVYEAPQPSYDDSSSFQQPEDIPRRRSPPRNQRPTQVQQPVQRPRADSQSRRPPPSQPRYIRNDEIPETRQQSQFKAAKLSVKPLPDDVDGDQIPGEAGIDYPTFHVIPSTSFSCGQQRHNGYYADVETSCQVMHLCQSGGVQSSFLCPNGTIFSQEKFSCQWWYKVNCADAPSHYGVNDKLYKVPPRPSRRNRE